jgi:hypothetical protein
MCIRISRSRRRFDTQLRVFLVQRELRGRSGEAVPGCDRALSRVLDPPPLASANQPFPIAVQIIAAPWREDVALRVAHALEQAGVASAPRPNL